MAKHHGAQHKRAPGSPPAGTQDQHNHAEQQRAEKRMRPIDIERHLPVATIGALQGSGILHTQRPEDREEDIQRKAGDHQCP